MNRIVTLSAALIVSGAAAAFAQEAPPAPAAPEAAPAAAVPAGKKESGLTAWRKLPPEQQAAKRFEKLDANKDGNIDSKEFSVSTQKRFKNIDANNDGKISREEMTAAQAKRKAGAGKKHEKPV